MKSLLKGSSIFVVILAIAYSTSSCRLPFKIVPNTAETDPPLVATTPPVPVAETQSPVATATADMVSIEDIMLPVAGSVLKWIDLSDFVYVPAGEFIMGQDSSTPSDHAPAHTVNLPGFWIQQAEVTNQQYAACVAGGECTAPVKESDTPYWYAQSDKVNNPVVGVTWLQANQYCKFIEGRLPTEAEWEITARGSKSTTYPWGEDAPNCSLLNYKNCLSPSTPGDVGSYPGGASEFKAMDMAGNVFEWVNDWYAEDYYPSSPATNPVGPVDGTQKVYRGGSYSSNLDDVNPVMRFALKPQEHSADIGFRCVLTGDYSAASNGNQVPRPCEVLPVTASQPEMQATWTPIPCQPALVTSGCTIGSGGQMRTWIDIYQSGCEYNLLSGIFSQALPDIDCKSSSSNLDSSPKDYTCHSPNMVQGMNVDIFMWHVFSVGQMVYDCPVGYVFDKLDGFCVPKGAWLPDPPCPFNYTELGDVCVPIGSSQNGCPVGFYGIMRETSPNNWTPVCEPLDQCLQNGGGANCNPPVCSSGQTYDPANNCCSKPGKLQQVCPVGLSMKTDSMTNKNFCEPISHLLDSEYRTVKIAYCPTPTPTPTAPPEEVCSCVIDPASGQQTCTCN